MPKNIHNADIPLKDFWRNNDRFADLFNASLFHGRQIIKSAELEEQDTEASFILEHNNHSVSFDPARDLLKVRKNSSVHGLEFAILGIENQSRIHYAMPMRIMGYDYSSYKRQYDNNAAKYRAKETASQTDGLTPDNSSNEMVSANTPDKLDPNEFLSRMKRTDKFSPVITIVIYYGEEPWDGARSLHEMLNIPNEFKKYVNDYKMLLIEARNPDLIFHNSDNIDFFNLMGIILNKNLSHKEARQEAILYSEEHQTDKSVIMAIAGATNIKINFNSFEKGDSAMCTLFDEIAKEAEMKGKIESRTEGKIEGRTEGKIEGKAEEIIETGFEFSMSKKDILLRLQTKLDITLQKALEYFSLYEKKAL